MFEFSISQADVATLRKVMRALKRRSDEENTLVDPKTDQRIQVASELEKIVRRLNQQLPPASHPSADAEAQK